MIAIRTSLQNGQPGPSKIGTVLTVPSIIPKPGYSQIRLVQKLFLSSVSSYRIRVKTKSYELRPRGIWGNFQLPEMLKFLPSIYRIQAVWSETAPFVRSPICRKQREIKIFSMLSLIRFGRYESELPALVPT